MLNQHSGLLLHLPLWEHSGNQRETKAQQKLIKAFDCPWYVQEYRTVETGAAHRGYSFPVNF